ncbi:MAG: flagellar hook-length control protein FliK [Aquificae bacterium]|nr:flagellar hook-length control protein FliK [Aquificota bacterium]
MINFKPFAEGYEYFQIVKPLGKAIHLKSGETVKAEVVDILPTGGVVIRMKGGYLTVETDIPLQKETSLLLKILDTPSSDRRLKIQLLGVLDKKGGNLQLFNLQQTKAKDILSLVENFPALKDSIPKMVLETLAENQQISPKNASTLATALAETVRNQTEGTEALNRNSFFFTDISKLKPEEFHKLIKDSGIFYESKIKSGNLKEAQGDFKQFVLSMEDSTEREALLKQIEGYQLLSRLTGGVFVFIPLFWQDLNRGDIFIKKSNKGKDTYFCKIDLDFKELGKVEAGIFLFNRELYLSIYIQNQQLKEEIQKDINQLTATLKKLNFKDVYIKFLKKPPEEREIIQEDFFSLMA